MVADSFSRRFSQIFLLLTPNNFIKGGIFLSLALEKIGFKSQSSSLLTLRDDSSNSLFKSKTCCFKYLFSIMRSFLIEFSETILLRMRSVDVCERGALSFAGRELQTFCLFSAF